MKVQNIKFFCREGKLFIFYYYATSIIGSVFSDYVVFYRDISFFVTFLGSWSNHCRDMAIFKFSKGDYSSSFIINNLES